MMLDDDGRGDELHTTAGAGTCPVQCVAFNLQTLRPDRFFFLHIPKTAGMSVHRLLEQLAGPYLHLQRPHELCWPAALVWDKFRGCGGHLYWAAAQRQGLLDGITFTFLREPVERLLSQFNFALSPELGGLPDSMRARTVKLKTLLRRSAGKLGSFSNVQTLALSGLGPNEGDPEDHLQAALSRLESLDLIGTTETLGDDVIELARLLGSVPPPAIPHENRSVHALTRGNLDQETLDLLAETQSLDRRLYTQATRVKVKRTAKTLLRDVPPPCGWPPPPSSSGTAVRITRVAIQAVDGGELHAGQGAILFVHWNSPLPMADLAIGFRIADVVGNYIGGTNSFLVTGRELETPAGPGCAAYTFRCTLGAGRYVIDAELHEANASLCYYRSAAVFEVKPPHSPYREGMVDIDTTFSLNPEPISGPLPEDVARHLGLQLNPHLPIEPAGQGISVPVQLANRSLNSLSSGPQTRLFISYHWEQPATGVRVQEGMRTALPGLVFPGETIAIHVTVTPPPTPGRWQLQLRLVQEAVRWHEGPGFEAAMPHDLELEWDASGGMIVLQ